MRVLAADPLLSGMNRFLPGAIIAGFKPADDGGNDAGTKSCYGTAEAVP